MLTPWTPEEKELINWFLNKKFSGAQFDLDGCRKVTNPEIFFNSLRREIALGPGSAVNRIGCLMGDLRLLYKQFEPNDGQTPFGKLDYPWGEKLNEKGEKA